MSEKEVRAGLPRSLRAYIVLVAVGGMVWLTYLAQSVEWGPSVLGEMGFFVALIVLAGSFPLPVGPRVKTDVAATALFAAALLLEPGAAALAGAVGVVTYTLLLRFWGQKIRVPWYKYPFNAGATALCVGMASALFHELAAGEGLLSTAVVPAACVYYLVNTGLVSGAAGLQLGVSPLRFWWKGTKDNGIAELSLFAFAFLGAVIYNESPWTVAVLFMPVAIIYIAFSRLAQKIQERELAEEALQKAKEELEIRVEMRTNELTKATEQLAHSRRRVVNSQEDLRKAVAQQLHGPVQNRLLVATHWLRTAQDKIGDGTGETAEQISKAAHLIDEINQGDLSAAVRRLHPSLIRMSLEASLRSLAAEFDGSFDVQVQLSGGTSSRDELWRTGLPEDLRLAIYRVAGAALSNVLKHASATKAELRLDLASEEMVRVTIVDNGCGFDAKTTTPALAFFRCRTTAGP